MYENVYITKISGEKFISSLVISVITNLHVYSVYYTYLFRRYPTALPVQNGHSLIGTCGFEYPETVDTIWMNVPLGTALTENESQTYSDPGRD